MWELGSSPLRPDAKRLWTTLGMGSLGLWFIIHQMVFYTWSGVRPPGCAGAAWRKALQPGKRHVQWDIQIPSPQGLWLSMLCYFFHLSSWPPPQAPRCRVSTLISRRGQTRPLCLPACLSTPKTSLATVDDHS